MNAETIRQIEELPRINIPSAGSPYVSLADVSKVLSADQGIAENREEEGQCK